MFKKKEKTEKAPKNKKVRTMKVGTHKKSVLLLWAVLLASTSFGVYKNFTAIDTHTVHEKEIIQLKLNDTNGIENFVKNFAKAYYTWDTSKEAIETRQTISNWENEKSYPDIHSLLLLSSLFNVSLDQLIKGDIEKMKEIISDQEIKKFNYYGSIYTVHLAVLIISAVPLFMWLGRYAYIPFGILFIITMYWALKVEKLKKKNDIQTYKEIVAFTEGKKLDELHKAVEVGKRPYQNILKVIISVGVTAMICFLIGVLMHVFLN